MKLTYTRLLMATIAIFCTFLAMAQNNDTLEIQKNERGKIIFGRFKHDESNKIKGGNIFLKKVLNANADNNFRLIT